MEKTQEKDLVEGLKRGDEMAYRRLMRDYREKTFAVAFGITLDREEAMEIVQDVFVSVFRNIDKFRGQSQISTWIYRITVNLSLNWKRKWKRRFRWHHRPIESEDGHLLPEAEKGEDNPERAVAGKQLERELMDGISRLPEKMRTVFVLHAMEGLSYEEIAGIVGVRRGTVSSRIHSARARLRDILGPGYEG